MFRLNEHQRRGVRFAARFAAVIASVVFLGLAITEGPPAPPQGPGIERFIQYVFVVIGIVSTVIAWRWSLPGGLLLVVAGVVLGSQAAGQFSEGTALLAALLYVVPGVLFLVHWASRHPAWLQLPLGVFVVALMVYGGLEARTNRQNAFGPAHPQSQLTRAPFDSVEWIWSGGVTSTSAAVRARVADDDAEQARLVVSTEASFASPLYSEYVDVRAAGDGIVALGIGGLAPDTAYFYAVEVDGVRDTERVGRFRTFPDTPATFSIVVSACARTGSNGLVFEAMAAEDALLYVNTGDFHYQNIETSNVGAFRAAYERQITAPAQQALYLQTPIAYVWDDHDFGGNNSTGASAAAPAARLTYRENVPHYEMPAGPGNAAIYQAFDIGSVRFVMTDTRSERDVERMADGSASLLGTAQREWLKQELLNGSRNYGLVVWVNSVPWIAPAGAADNWGSYATERAEIANFIADNGITNMLMLSGDAHMLAIDDGTNTDYSTSGGASFPVMQAAALDRPGSSKGGPYSEGGYPGAGQYGLVTFTHTDDGMTVKLSGRNWLQEEIVGYEFEVPQPHR